MIGRGHEIELWKIITQSARIPQVRDEDFSSLQKEIFKANIIQNIPESQEEEEEEDQQFIDAYVVQEAVDGVTERYDIDISVNLDNQRGSTVIRDLKKQYKERGRSITHEHLLCERIYQQNNQIVLVGATGSGKTYKLEYIWKRYLKNRTHCRKLQHCKYHRLRIKIDVDDRACKSEVDLYNEVHTQISAAIESLLIPQDYRIKYKQFVAEAYKKLANGANIPYLATLAKYGLRRDIDPPTLQELDARCPAQDRIRRDLALFAMSFSGWLRRRYCQNNSFCMHLVFDNIDASPRPVQNAIIKLMESTSPKGSILIICACRPETFINWKHRSKVLDLIPHIGPSAYEVVMQRLEGYLAQNISRDMLEDQLQGLRKTEDFLANLKFLKLKLKRPHFKLFFDQHFGWQIRDGLVFAEGIIDIAAGRSEKELKDYILSRSDYALERLLYLPWGLAVPKKYVVNVFDLGNGVIDRLGALRVIILLNSSRPYSLDVRHVYQHLKMFGYTQSRCMRVLSTLLERRVVLAASKENLDLGKFKTAKNEKLRLTTVGEGLWKQAYDLSYIESMMYFCPCKAQRYKDCWIGITPDLLETFSILREFLVEIGEVDLYELEFVKTKHSMHVYNNLYELKTITQGLYERTIPTLVRIATAVQRRPKSQKSYINLLQVGLNFLSDFELHSNEIQKRFHWIPNRSDELNAAANTIKRHFLR